MARLMIPVSCLGLLRLLLSAVAGAVFWGFVVGLCHAQTASGISARPEPEYKILFLRSYGYGREGPESYNGKFFSVLIQAGVSSDDVMLEYLDLNRNRDAEYRVRKRELLLHQYLGKPIDLIVAVEQPALIFLLEELKDLAPTVPVMAINATVPAGYSANGRRFVQKTVNLDFKGTMERALELFPETRRVVVVTGNGEQDLAVKRESEQAAAPWGGRLDFAYTDNLSMAEILERVADLPPQTVVVYRAVNRDRTGEIFIPFDALLEITKVANAPVFGLYNNYVGATGVVGGSVYHITEEAERAARIALKILNGSLHLTEPVTTLPSEGVPMFDWQQIQRWSGDPSRLPRTSIFVNRPPSLWEQHRAIVVATVLLFLAMVILVAVLLAENRRRRVAETSAREKESLLSASQEIARLGSWSYDWSRRRLTWSDELYRIFGVDPSEFHPSYEAFLDLVHPEDREAVRSVHVSSLRERKNAYDIEHRIVLQRTGEVRIVQERCLHIRTVAGRAIRSMGILQDVTESKQVEEALRTSENRYRTLYNSTPVMMHSIDPQGEVVSVSDYWLRELGYTREEVIGRPYTDFLTEESSRYSREAVLPEVFRSGFCKDIPHRFVKKNGEIMDTLLSAISERDREGEIIRSLAVMIDITDRKRVEEALVEAKSAAEAASRAKSTFLANMSHEIRTPINAMLGFSKILKEGHLGDLNPKQAEYVGYIIESTTRLLTVVNDILDLARVEAGKLEICPVVFDFARFMERVSRAMEELAARRGLDFQVQIAPDIPTHMIGDDHRIEQVLRNLITNAVKFTEEGGVTVSARMSAAGELSFTVRDTGIGIPKDKQEGLFSKFHQVDSSYARKYAGTGLGLAICKELLELMGGEIGFESEPGAGSSFFFTLKVGVPESGSATPEQKALQPGDELHAKRPLNILLAEDDHLTSRSMTLLLKRQGHVVTHVWNGVEALHALEAGHFDLILMDVQMPEMDGVEATRRIRASTSGTFDPRIPIIAMTAYAMQGDREKFLHAGMDDYISKPVDFQILLSTIQRFAGGGLSGGDVGEEPADMTSDALDDDIAEIRFDDIAEIRFFVEDAGDDPGFAREVLDRYPADVSERMGQLEKAIQSGNATEIARACHKFIGLFSAVLIRSAATMARELQNAALSNDLERCRRLFLDLKGKMRQIVHHIQKIKAERWKTNTES